MAICQQPVNTTVSRIRAEAANDGHHKPWDAGAQVTGEARPTRLLQFCDTVGLRTFRETLLAEVTRLLQAIELRAHVRD